MFTLHVPLSFRIRYFRNERTRFNTPNSAKRSGSANPMGKSYCHTCLSGRHKNSIGGKAPALYEKLSRLETLLPGVRQAFSDKVSSNATDEVIGQAQEILALKREIILANPLLDMDKIIVARYRLGDKARKAMGPSMGTSTATTTRYFPTRVKATMPRSTCSRACADKSKAAGYTNPKPMFPFRTYSSTGMPTASSSPRSTRTGSGRYTK